MHAASEAAGRDGEVARWIEHARGSATAECRSGVTPLTCLAPNGGVAQGAQAAQAQWIFRAFFRVLFAGIVLPGVL